MKRKRPMWRSSLAGATRVPMGRLIHEEKASVEEEASAEEEALVKEEEAEDEAESEALEEEEEAEDKADVCLRAL